MLRTQEGGDKEIITQFGLENVMRSPCRPKENLDSQTLDGTDTTGGSISFRKFRKYPSKPCCLSKYFITDESDNNILNEDGSRKDTV